MKTQKEIKLKDGNILPRGLPVRFSQEFPSRCFVSGPVREYQVRVTSAFKTPSLAALERWSNDGVCESVTGDRVEPDGFGPDGAPSWLLALSLI